MKKKTALLLCMLLTVSMLGACGKATEETSAGSGSETASAVESSSEETKAVTESSSEETEEERPTELEGYPIVGADTPLEECITLGDYKGIEVVKRIKTITRDDVLESLESELREYVKDPDYGAKEGDIVDIAFIGKKDGEAFEGGSADSYELELGSHSFIDGFEEGCIGMKLDESRDLNLTFPENYGNADLAGQDVVFEVTINAIMRPCEYSKEWLLETYTEYDSEEAFFEERTAQLQAIEIQTAESELESKAMQMVMDNATYTALLDNYIADGEEIYDSQYTYYATMYGISLDDFIEIYSTKEEYLAARQAYAVSVAKANMMMDAISRAEGWTEQDEAYVNKLTEYADQYNMTTEDLLAQYGEDKIKTNIIMDRVIELVMDNAVITEEYYEE